jgi:nitrile hydratase accessory protein
MTGRPPATLPVRLDVDGLAAPPRSNGELVFAEPWQSRAFGMTMALTTAGTLDWEEFRQQLIVQVAGWEQSAPSGETFSYYDCWLDALEHVLVARALVTSEAVHHLAGQIAARPAGWDHDHDHPGHAHDHPDHPE